MSYSRFQADTKENPGQFAQGSYQTFRSWKLIDRSG